MSRYKRIDVAELEVDARYQRPLDMRRVNQMVRQFDIRQFGVLEVSQRNGHSTVFDGQHRLEVARRLDMATVPCVVHQDLTPEQEAELFVSLQRNRRGVTQLDRFKARLFQGDPDAIEINDAVEGAGFKIRDAGKYAGEDGAIKAITSLERVYRRGNLPETLNLLGHLWGGDAKSTDGGLIEGLSLVLDGYERRLLKPEEPIARLRATAPVTILRRAVGHAGGGSAKGVLVAKEIRRVAGLRGKPTTRHYTLPPAA